MKNKERTRRISLREVTTSSDATRPIIMSTDVQYFITYYQVNFEPSAIKNFHDNCNLHERNVLHTIRALSFFFFFFYCVNLQQRLYRRDSV